MPGHILSTKLFPPPPAPMLVERGELLGRITQGVKGSLTIVSAPPGFGKTTLISSWLSSGDQKKIAWYSLDEDDNDPIRFFKYITASLRTVEPDSVHQLSSLLEALTPDPREIVITLINNWLERSTDDDIILVLDDYHSITSQTIHDAIAYLVDHLPATLHLIFISRADPPLPLGRWRVRGQLTEIRADDLRFTQSEAAQFLNQSMGLSLTEQDIQTLETRTEGWVAGLQLAALSLKNTSNPSEVIAAFAGSNRYVAEYLTDEVLSRQPETLREFLLKTSILERFNVALCDHVLQTKDSETILIDLNRANLFIIPLDSESNWYRYHHLFADLLKRRPQNETTELHRRAAEWFENNNFILDAIRHWIAANEPDRVAALMERGIIETWGQVELTGLMHRVESLPESVLAEYPALSAFLGWSWLWLGYKSEQILPLINRAEENLKGKGASPYLGRLNVVRSSIVRVLQNNSEESIRLARLALKQLPPTDFLWRSFSQLGIAIATHASGKLTDAEQAYDGTIHLCEQAGEQVTTWIAACARVQVVMERGELNRSIALNRQLLDSIRGKVSTSLVRGWSHINQALLMYQVNDLESTQREANITLELERATGGMPDVGLRLYALLTKLALINKDESAARDAAGKLITLAKRGGATNAVDWANAVFAELMFRLKDWTTFDSWARAYRPSLQPLFFPYRLATIQYLRYLARQKAWDESRRLLDEQVRLAREAGYVEFEMELHIVGALLEAEAGKSSASIKMLERALEIGEAGGYVRIFVDEGDAMRMLLLQMQKQVKDDALRSYVTDLLTAFDGSAAMDQSALIEPLTEREIEVLKLIAEGLSNPEIAKKLFLSVGTVKTHVKHIYGKLNLDDRVKAASKARELRLIN
jgi:LuxR family transcriptional regulator, maltose regulon positive regulatory protein